MLENDAIDTSVFTAKSVTSESLKRLGIEKTIENKGMSTIQYATILLVLQIRSNKIDSGLISIVLYQNICCYLSVEPSP